MRTLQNEMQRTKKYGKWGLLALTLLLFSSISSSPVFADWQDQERCQVRTPCNIQRLLINDTGTPLAGASCNATIKNLTTILLANASMTDLANGYYNITFTPNNTGRYPSHMVCAFGTSLAVSDISFTAAKKESWSNVFQLAIPVVMLAISLATLAAFFIYKQERSTLIGETVRHGLLILCFVFFLVAIISVKHVTDFENDTSNATLTRLSGLVEVVYIGALWMTVGLILWAGASLVLKGATLLRKQALDRKNRDETLYQDFPNPDDDEKLGGVL